MATIDPIDSLSRVLALADGRDPAEATANDRDRSIEFLNLFHAASYWSCQRDPCQRCRGSGIEPLVRKADPPPVIPKAA